MIDRMITSLLSATLLLSCSATPPEETLSGLPSQMGQAADSTTPSQVAADTLPSVIGDRVKADLAAHLGVPVDRLSIESYSRETWSDGCLGLGGPAESCLAALTEGWRVEVIDTEANQRHVYRTDLAGDQIRRQEQDREAAQSLPSSVRDRIFEAAQADASRPSESLGIIAAEQQTWNGCYGLAAANEGCTMIAIPGWRAVISDGNRYWIYHTDATGETVRLNATASGSTIPARFMAMVNPMALGDETGIQSTITYPSGQKKTFMLEATGQLVYIQQHDDNVIQQDTYLLDQEQLQSLLDQLAQHNFSHLDGIRYQPSADQPADDLNAAVVTLTTRTGTVEYVASERDALPADLQAIIQAWTDTIAPMNL